MFYLLCKALHLIFMVCWFAALFYLPRLYVHHAMAQEAGELDTIKRMISMEGKLYTIGHIGMGLTLVFGIAMLVDGGWAAFKSQGWLHAKLLLVLLLIIYYLVCGYYKRVFARGENRRSHVYFRIFNEVPSVILILVCLLAVLKPF